MTRFFSLHKYTLMNTIIICILVTLLLVYYMMSRDATQPTQGLHYDSYEVLGDYPDHKEAAELLSNTNDDIINYLRYLKNKYLVYRRRSDDKILKWSEIMDKDRLDELYEPVYPSRLVGIVQRIITNYNPETIIENRPGGGDTSYTVDKGKRMYVCLRDSKQHKLHDKSILLFVILHEIAHIGNSGWGHGVSDFWPTFKFIAYEAVNFGIIKPVDYARNPVVYCGLQINYSPLFDKTLPNWWEPKKR
jgi:hypothetical protein